MKFHRENPNTTYHIRAYQATSVTVNEHVIQHSMIIMPDYLSDWEVDNFAALTPAHFQRLVTLQPELVLLGTGQWQHFPDADLTAPLTAHNIGVEVMNLAAACRTYNILLAEERRVVAALLFD